MFILVAAVLIMSTSIVIPGSFTITSVYSSYTEVSRLAGKFSSDVFSAIVACITDIIPASASCIKVWSVV